MRTEQLIQSLTLDVRALSRYAIGQRIAVGTIGGAAIAIALMIAFLGLRSDLGTAVQSFPLWMKWGYTSSVGMVATAATSILARPEAARWHWLWLIAAPIVLLTGIAIAQLADASQGTVLDMWLGQSWASCPWRVLLLSLPIFVGLLWSFRQFAPTRLRMAGAVAGLSAGAWAATLYSLHCPEVSAMFVLTWYSLGIGLATSLGALLGPRLLRW